MDALPPVKHSGRMGGADIAEFTFAFPPWAEAVLAFDLALIMFAVALGLTPASFAFLRTRPRAYVAGVVSQLVLLPVVTIALCWVLRPAPSVAVGMIVVACCPGGASSNLLALWARANMGLSVSLTATSSLLAALITPISILFWTQGYPPAGALVDSISIDVAAFFVQIFALLGVPILLGMTVRAKAPEWAVRWQGRLALAGGVLLAAIIIVSTALTIDVFLALGVGITAIVIAHNLVAFATGWLAARTAKLAAPDRRTVAIETGIQNSGLALVIIVAQMQGLGGAIAVVAIWGLVHLSNGVCLVGWWRRTDAHA